MHLFFKCQGMSDILSWVFYYYVIQYNLNVYLLFIALFLHYFYFRPILFVMGSEAPTYLTFCALMERLKNNFCNRWLTDLILSWGLILIFGFFHCNSGTTMSRKFSDLRGILRHYDKEFYQYLQINNVRVLINYYSKDFVF